MELKFTNHEDRDFVRKLNNRVSGYFASNDLKKQANAWGWIKAALLLSAYLLSYVGIYDQDASGALVLFRHVGCLENLSGA